MLNGSYYSLSNWMDNSLLTVRSISHKYIVVKKGGTPIENQGQTSKIKTANGGSKN